MTFDERARVKEAVDCGSRPGGILVGMTARKLKELEEANLDWEEQRRREEGSKVRDTLYHVNIMYVSAMYQ